MKYQHWFPKKEQEKHNLSNIDYDFKCPCGPTICIQSGLVVHYKINPKLVRNLGTTKFMNN